MSAFPNIVPVLFMGKIYSSDQIPHRFFPTLLILQLTEPALILIIIGFSVSIWLFVKGKAKEPILLFSGWFLIPALWVVLSHSNLYDNAASIIISMAAALDDRRHGNGSIDDRCQIPVLKAALLIVIAMPGIVACIQLHPYEYIYYNSLIGGVPGAYRKFELDYWATSFKNASNTLIKQCNLEPELWLLAPERLLRI